MSGVGERVAELAARRVPFVLARVVLAERPTSARPGDEALVLADGTMEGFVGGDCAEATVRAQALAVLDSGEPVVLRISADGRATAGRQGDGAQPLPQRRHPGDLPRTASPSAADGRGRRWSDRPGAAHHQRSRWLRGGRAPARPISPRSSSPRTAGTRAAPLSAALKSGVDYVGLVASPKRGAAVVGSARRHAGPSASSPRPGWTSAPARRRRSHCRSART